MNRAITATRKINLGLPKFNLTSENKELNETLKALGINSIFNSGNQRLFSNGPSDLLCKTNQGASISIDEEGAEIAAVTSGGFICGAAPPPPMETIDITFDRPFLFFVTENSTNSVLLAGKVMNL